MKPAQEILDMMPEFPRIRHLPWKANAKRDDLICSEAECRIIFDDPDTVVMEKVDGSQCRMGILDGHPLIGNRNHILTKNYSRQRTAATMQYSSIWNWWYNHQHLFERLKAAGPYTVYGDWMFMAHGMVYDQLPSLFIPYDVYDYESRGFLPAAEAMSVLCHVGFVIDVWCRIGKVESFEALEAIASQESRFSSSEPREGVVVKAGDKRFKMVRQGFQQGCLLSKDKIVRNKLAKGLQNV